LNYIQKGNLPASAGSRSVLKPYLIINDGIIVVGPGCGGDCQHKIF
jgi:hypothetical protein